MSVFFQTQYMADSLSEAFTNGDSSRSAIIDACVLRNNGTLASLVALYIVPNGGTADASNKLFEESLSPGESLRCDEITGSDLGPGDALWAEAAEPATIVMRVTGRLRD